MNKIKEYIVILGVELSEDCYPSLYERAKEDPTKLEGIIKSIMQEQNMSVEEAMDLFSSDIDPLRSAMRIAGDN